MWVCARLLVGLVRDDRECLVELADRRVVGVDVETDVDAVADIERRRVVLQDTVVVDKSEVGEVVAIVGAVKLNGLGPLIAYCHQVVELVHRIESDALRIRVLAVTMSRDFERNLGTIDVGTTSVLPVDSLVSNLLHAKERAVVFGDSDRDASLGFDAGERTATESDAPSSGEPANACEESTPSHLFRGISPDWSRNVQP
jgi:hypothetical protein